MMIAEKERKYNKKEFYPLGTTRSNNTLPDHIKQENHTFGVKSKEKTKEMQVHDLIGADRFGNPESDKIHKLYIRSHHSYRPGEKLCRNYTNWEDTKDMTFGILSKVKTVETVEDCLKWSCSYKTNIISREQYIRNRGHDPFY
jgi:hypothetical protein